MPGSAREGLTSAEPRAHQAASPLARPGGWAWATLAGAVCLAPLPFGSNAPMPIGLLGLTLAIGLACAPVPVRTAQRRVLAALAGLTGVILAVVGLQLGPWVGDDPVWADAARRLGSAVAGGAALVSHAPLFASGNLALCLASTALGLLVGTDRRRARGLVRAIAWSALVYAAIGVANALFDPEALLWRDRDDYAGAVLGPFVNRNTAAIYFGCGTLLWATRFGAALRLVGWPIPPSAQPWKALAGPGLAAGFCLGAVVATGSRSGTLLSLGALIAVGLVSVRGLLTRLPTRLRAVVLGAPCSLAVLTLLSGAAGMRLHSLGFADEGRLAVYRAVLPIIADHPWLGTGLGTFASVYPAYRSSVPGMRNVWDKAHSTPLELAAEVGLPLTVLICAALLAAFLLLARGAVLRRRDGDIPLAAAACLGLAAAHSCIDFSLQIPGLAVVVLALCGVGLAQAFSSGDGGEAHTPKRRGVDAPGAAWSSGGGV